MFYCVELARFLSRDMRPRAASNRYAYVKNDPLGLIDANGLEEDVETPEEKSAREEAARKAKEALDKANEERRRKREGQAVVNRGEIDSDDKRPRDSQGRPADVAGVTTFDGKVVVEYICSKDETEWSIVSVKPSFTINVDIESLDKIKVRVEKKIGQPISDDDAKLARKIVLDYEEDKNAKNLKSAWDSQVAIAKAEIEKLKASTEDALKKAVKEKIDGLIKDVADKTYAIKEADTKEVNKRIEDDDKKIPLPTKEQWQKIFQQRFTSEIKKKQ